MQCRPINKIWILSLLVIFTLVGSADAKHRHPEKYYQEKWCFGRGEMEVVLPDRTRCDCLTLDHAIEFDFGPKWSEAIGQSLYYSMQTGRKAGIVLILEKKSDYKYWIRLNSVIKNYDLPIDTWSVSN